MGVIRSLRNFLDKEYALFLSLDCPSQSILSWGVTRQWDIHSLVMPVFYSRQIPLVFAVRLSPEQERRPRRTLSTVSRGNLQQAIHLRALPIAQKKISNLRQTNGMTGGLTLVNALNPVFKGRSI